MAVLGSTPGIIVGVGVGTAASVALEPAIELPKQNAWARNKNRILPVATMAALVAQGGVELGAAQDDGARDGYDTDKVDALVYLAQTVPGFAEALAIWRRNHGDNIDRSDFSELWSHALTKNGLDARYKPFLNDLVWDRLSAQATALGIIRSMIDDPGFLPVTLDTSGGKVPAYPKSSIDPIREAQATGFDKERLRVMVGSIGRPPGPGEAARAAFRNIIERADFNRAILEGDVRPEWADAFYEVSREILTASQYAELELRGFYDKATRRKKTAQHGMSDEDSDDLVNLEGRSITVHQVTTGLARGGKYPGSYANVPEPFRSAIQRSNIREEWSELDYANRYSLPSAFVLRALLQDGALTEAQGEQYFLDLGWPPALAKEVAAAYAPQGTVAKINPWVKAQQTRLVTALHKAAVKGGAARTALEPYLEPLVPDLADRDAIFQLWADEAAVVALGG